MRKEDLTALFDRQAAGYDQQWSKIAPISDALHLLTEDGQIDIGRVFRDVFRRGFAPEDGRLENVGFVDGAKLFLARACGGNARC